MSRLDEAEIAVVGAGASGLSAAACLVRRGRRPVILHRDERVGATWRGRYDRLHLHTTRRFSGLPYHRLPRSYGRFVSKDDYARYLEEYAGRLALDVRGGLDVSAISPAGNGKVGWALETSGGRWTCDAVIVATGRHCRKVLPNLPPGIFVHVHDIFIPYEYPTNYDELCYTEQYLLHCLLSGSSRYRTILSTHYLSRNYATEMQQSFGEKPGSDPLFSGASYWFEVVS